MTAYLTHLAAFTAGVLLMALFQMIKTGDDDHGPRKPAPAEPDTTDPVMAAFHSPRLGNGAVPYAPIEEV